jgi:hypothetical protein
LQSPKVTIHINIIVIMEARMVQVQLLSINQLEAIILATLVRLSNQVQAQQDPSSHTIYIRQIMIVKKEVLFIMALD